MLDRAGREWEELLAAVVGSNGDVLAPELVWSEATSVLRELTWRGLVSDRAAGQARALLASAPIVTRRPRRLRERAWEIADAMGWARTYDAEYCALAALERCDLVTTDGRLRASGGRLGFVRTPAEAAGRLRAG